MNNWLIAIYALWMLPETLIGSLLILFGGTKFFRREKVFMFLATPGGLFHRFFIKGGFVAITIGPFIVFDYEYYATPRIIRHENRHVTQGWWFGPLRWFFYYLSSGWAWVNGGGAYHDNIFEQDARAHSDFPK